MKWNFLWINVIILEIQGSVILIKEKGRKKGCVNQGRKGETFIYEMPWGLKPNGGYVQSLFFCFASSTDTCDLISFKIWSQKGSVDILTELSEVGIFRQQSVLGENTVIEMTYKPDNEEFQGPVSVLPGTNLLCSLGIIVLSPKTKALGKVAWVLFWAVFCRKAW